jgi:hypothetical protein
MPPVLSLRSTSAATPWLSELFSWPACSYYEERLPSLKAAFREGQQSRLCENSHDRFRLSICPTQMQFQATYQLQFAC